MIMLSARSRKNPVFLSGELPRVLGHYLASILDEPHRDRKLAAAEAAETKSQHSGRKTGSGLNLVSRPLR
jgi:hypothetical protein